MQEKLYLKFKQCFRLESGKICKNNDNTFCNIALTLAGSLRRCLNTRPNSLMFKQLPRDLANLSAWKKYVIPLLSTINLVKVSYFAYFL